MRSSLRDWDCVCELDQALMEQLHLEAAPAVNTNRQGNLELPENLRGEGSFED
jgi:hypothetical protein